MATRHLLTFHTGLALVMTASLAAQDWRLLDGLRQPLASGAFDEARGRIVTVGDRGETREWDGIAWRQRPIVALPSAPVQMAYDSLRGVTVALLGAGAQLATWEFDGVAWRLRTTAVAPPVRLLTCMCFDAVRGRTVLFGGGLFGPPYQDTWEWDGVVWQQVAPAVSPPARTQAAMAFDAARGRVVLFGGVPAFSQPLLQDTWEWDGSQWLLRNVPNPPPPRNGYAMAFDAARQRIVLTSGLGATAVGTYEYDGIQWLPRPGPQPPARANAALVHDVGRQRSVLFGGDLQGLPNDVWEWDGANWTARSVPSDPPFRSASALAHSLARDRTVLFGGFGSSGALADTWEWDGQRWLPQQPTTSPPPRSRHAMWSDPADVYVFGGYGPSFALLADTWRYDGSSWYPVLSGVSPPARRAHAGAFDPAGGGQLLFGGQDAGLVLFGDTWVLRANGWSQVVVTPGPSPRASPAIATDLLRQRVVLFGGIGTSGAPLDDTWEWNGAAWTQANPPVRPTSTSTQAMAYEPTLGVVVLLTRTSPTDATSAAWLWNGVTWQRHVTPTVLQQPADSWAAGARGALRLHDGNHLFELAVVSPTVTDYGTGCGTPAPRLGADVWPRPGAADFGLTTVGHDAGALLLFLLADQPANLPLAGCTLFAQLDGVVALAVADARGTAGLPLPIPATSSLVAAVYHGQAWSLGAAGSRATAGLRVLIGS
jgi:hypothetical protein